MPEHAQDAPPETVRPEMVRPQTARDPLSTPIGRGVFRFLVAVLAIGFVYRLATLVVPIMPLERFFITEDGYLMLTVARNLAIGHGLSVSDGTIETNGVQPLATFLYAIPYWLTEGDKTAGIAGVVLVMALFSVLGAIGVHRFARDVLRDTDASALWPLLVAALWFAGPLLMRHTMNALETGLYTAVVLALILYAGRLMGGTGLYTRREQIALGALSGLAFLARNDGAMLVAAIFLVRLVHVPLTGKGGVLDAVREAIPPGLISLVIAAPWLVHNYLLFGSIVPVSGHSQSQSDAIGRNLPVLPADLFEQAFPMLTIPASVETLPLVQAVASIAVAAVAVVLVAIALVRRGGVGAMLAAYLIYAALITGYYALFFGADHFLSRYLSPTAPLLITGAILAALMVAKRLGESVRLTALPLGGAAAALLCVALLGRLLVPGVHQQGHFRVVAWVEENVAEATWVGAVQTGTLGYWHDRTVNLDGKVNPDAMRARIERGDVLDYVVDSRIDYLADWAGIATWVDAGNPRFAERFEVVVREGPGRKEGSLGVLRRKEPVAPADGEDTPGGSGRPDPA